MEVDPRQRLVTGTLETEWNQALRELAQAKEEHELQRVRDVLSDVVVMKGVPHSLYSALALSQ